MANEKPIRVLTLDGGGMRGLYTAVVLHTMMKRFADSSDASDLDIGKAFDLIVGTSTGGILACALAAGVPTGRIIELYSKYGSKIFSNPIPKKKRSLAFWIPRNCLRSANRNEVLNQQLNAIFKDETVKGVYERRGIALCIPAVNMATHAAWVFKTSHNPGKHRDDKYLLSDVCLATSAAPIYLPLVSIQNPDVPTATTTFADGGLWANNPIMIGLVEALGMSEASRPIEVLSIGTCAPPAGKVTTGTELNVGLLGWQAGVKPLELSIDAQATGYSFMAGFLAKELTKLGRKCTILRIPPTSPSAEHMEFMGLDRACEKSVQVLSQLGSHDGSLAHGKAHSGGDADYQMLKRIFESMPKL